MKIVEADAVELIQSDLFKHIELCGRTCYKSEDKITDDSARVFVKKLIDSKHGAMLEHGTVYLDTCEEEVALRYKNNRYSRVNTYINPNGITIPKYAITTNFRVLVENNCTDDLYYLSEPNAYHSLRRTFKITCDRGVTHEFVRHRVFSFAQESTRYCNYSKDKFGNEITVIKPCFFEEGTKAYETWRKSCDLSESSYFDLIILGASPQQARTVLPNSLKAELVMTGFIEEWEGYFKLRCVSSAHPQAKEVADKIKALFKNE